MATPDSDSKLVRWDVPFADWKSISTWAIGEKGYDKLTVVVAPMSENYPIDNYPKYLIRFDEILTFLTCEEMFNFGWNYFSIPGWTEDVCAYQWVDSPLLNSGRGWFEACGKKLNHYVILGEEYATEVISVGEARLEKIESKQIIKVEHEV